MRFRQHLGFGFSILLAAAVQSACGEDAGKAPEGASGSGGARGGSGGKGGKSGQGGRGGNAGSSGAAGEAAFGGEGGEPAGGTGGSGKGGSSGKGGTGGNTTAHCEDPWSEPNTSTECDIASLPMNTSVALTGDITTNLTLESGSAYRLSGPTRVTNGAVLTIEPCVRIEGQTPESLLAILPGSRLEAAGEEDRPIVFTSSESPGNRGPGDWGGIIILGNAYENFLGVPEIEGLIQGEPYGSNSDAENDENSGTLTYVRVEYVGREVSANNETNGITFGGVGSGTTVHHVMVSNSLDDCFEWFGGEMNPHHLIAFNCDDDMFDTDAGFRGTVQFAFGRQYPTTAEADSSGFEMDGIPSMSEAGAVATSASWSNVTLCGARERSVNGDRFGMAFRNTLGGAISNAIITGFDIAVKREPAVGAATLMHTLAFGNTELVTAATAGGQAWFLDQGGNDFEEPDGFCDCWADPPNPFPAMRISGGAPPAGAADPNADFIGAFEDSSPESNWMTGKWVDWADQ